MSAAVREETCADHLVPHVDDHGVVPPYAVASSVSGAAWRGTPATVNLRALQGRPAPDPLVPHIDEHGLWHEMVGRSTAALLAPAPPGRGGTGQVPHEHQHQHQHQHDVVATTYASEAATSGDDSPRPSAASPQRRPRRTRRGGDDSPRPFSAVVGISVRAPSSAARPRSPPRRTPRTGRTECARWRSGTSRRRRRSPS